jgi:hypothetical protein
MKKTIQILCIVLLSTMTMASCSNSKTEDKEEKKEKTEDEKITEALVGNFNIDDKVKENVTTKNVKFELSKNGKFTQDVTFETPNPEYDGYNDEKIEINVIVSGKWKVKKKFINWEYDTDNVMVSPESYKEVVVNSMKNDNKPDEVISYSDSKIVTKDSKGEKSIWRKSK